MGGSGPPMGGSGPPMGGSGAPMAGGGPPMAGGNPNPGGAGGGNPNPGGNPPPPPVGTYMTVDPELKAILDKGLTMKPAPIVNVVIVARVLDHMQTGKAQFAELDEPNKVPISSLLKHMGMGLQSFGSDRLQGWYAFDCNSDLIAQGLETGLNLTLPIKVASLEQEFLGLKITLAPPPQTGNAGGGIPGGFGGGPPMGGGFPPMGGGGPPMGGGGPPMGGFGPPMGGGAPMGGYPAGLSGVNGGGPQMGGGVPAGGGFPGPGGIGGGPPMAGGFPNPGGGKPDTTPADLTVQRQERTVTLAANIKVVPDLYRDFVFKFKPYYVKARGQSEMMSGRPRIHEFAAALKACVEKNGGSFPQGAFPRSSPAERAGRPWPADQRISWMAEVIRFLPQFAGEPGAYPLGIKPDLSWREKDNLVASSTLIPQFLGSKSAKDQWWVKYPKIDQEVASTHYVGVAGIGLDAAYLAEPTRMGVFGIDRVTTLAQITDGPDKTIAVLQVPPTFKRPWLAGGGSTLQGVTEKDSIRPFVCADYNGKRGTYAIMANGDVRFILETIPDDVFKAMCTIAGGEKVDFEQYALLIKPDPNEMVARPDLPGKPAGGDKPAGGGGDKPAGGGGEKPPVSGGDKPASGGGVQKARTENDLKQLVLAYHSHLDATKKPPSKIDDLAPYLEKNSPVIGAVKDGSLVMYWNVDIFKLTAGTSNTILAYENDTPTKGGMVGMADGSIKTMTADDFKKAAKPPGQ
jgi:hypothetical protein